MGRGPARGSFPGEVPPATHDPGGSGVGLGAREEEKPSAQNLCRVALPGDIDSWTLRLRVSWVSTLADQKEQKGQLEERGLEVPADRAKPPSA